MDALLLILAVIGAFTVAAALYGVLFWIASLRAIANRRRNVTNKGMREAP